MVVASRAARKGVRSGAREGAKERARARAKGDALSRVFCVMVLLGPVIVLHSMVAKAGVSSRLARDPRAPHLFRLAFLEGDTHDWVTGAGAFTFSVPSLQNCASLHFDGKFISDSGATMAMGGVELLTDNS